MTRRHWHIEAADLATDRDDLDTIRHTVFGIEQHVPEELEWDAWDATADHVLARDDEGRPIGCGRLTREHSIGRMAVLVSWRGSGVGAAMLDHLIERAREHGWNTISLHAQVHAMGFYERRGFIAKGAVFEEAGIDHRTMVLTLGTRDNS